MRHLLLAAVLGMGCSAVQANALSCSDVDELGEALLTIGIALEDENLQIDAGGAEHIGLAETVEGLAQIAAAENDQDLANASLGMAHAWDANNRDAFTDALAEAVAKLAVISATECD